MLKQLWQRFRSHAPAVQPQMSTPVTGGAEPPFKGASYTRRAGALWNAHAGSANADLLPHLVTLRARSRQLIRNNPLAGGAVQTLTDNVIGPGLRLQPQVDRSILKLTDSEADATERALLALWQEWGGSEEADLHRISDWHGLQQIAFHSVHESGDVLALVPMLNRPGSRFRTRVQLVEADRVDNPPSQLNSDRLVAGVELDQFGAPKAYHVKRVHPGERYFGTLGNRSFETQRVQAFGIETGRKIAWLTFARKRPGQNRGIPYLAGVLEPLRQLERYTDGELQAAIVSGAFTVFVKTDDGQGLAPIATMPTGPMPQPPGTDLVLDYAMINTLAKGQSIEIANPARPNTAFGDFIRSNIEQIGAGLGQGYEMIIKHFTNSYSSSRAALLQAWKFYTRTRQWFAQTFCDPVYEAVITEAVARGFIVLPGYLENALLRQAYLGTVWIGPAQGQLNPVDEANAAVIRINGMLSTHAQECAEFSGLGWEQIVAQRRKEEEAKQAAGLVPDPAEAPTGTAAGRDRQDTQPDTEAA